MAAMGSPETQPRYLFMRTRINRRGSAPYSMATMHLRLKQLAEKLAITDSAGRPVEISKTHRFRHTAATNLINAGVPLHVVMRYFGHVSPEMTLH
jgi:integrase